MDELLHLGRHIGSGGGEDVGRFQADLLPYQAEHGAVVELILHFHMEGHALSAPTIVHIALATHRYGVPHQLPLHGGGLVHALLHGGIDLLPEARDGRHARGMGLAHALLYLLRVGIDNQLRTNGKAQVGPGALKDVGEGQKVDHPVLVTDGNALLVGRYAGAVLSVGEDDSLAVARRAAGIENVADVVVARFCPQFLHFRLPWEVLSELDEVAEVQRIGVIGADADTGVVDDHALQGRTKGDDAVCLVILLLLSDKQEAHAGILNHVLYLLLGAGGVERNCLDFHAIGTEIGVKILDTILREHGYRVAGLAAKVEQGVGNLLDTCRELIPRDALPF